MEDPKEEQKNIKTPKNWSKMKQRLDKFLKNSFK